jgi:hypothetical protein
MGTHWRIKERTMKAVCFFLFLACISAYAQDPAMDAMQQNIQAGQQASQQATQQAIDQMQLANQLARQQMNMDTPQIDGRSLRKVNQDDDLVVALTAQPAFSIKSGDVPSGTTVSIKCRTRRAVIYYTTNGWTPTVASHRYLGPIRIDSGLELQAIAIAPHMARSLVEKADYTVEGPQAAIQPIALPADGVLAAGTRLHLVTGSQLNSRSAQVGDNISILLNQEIRAGNAIIVPKGTPVQATITLADPAGRAGVPGELAFAVRSLSVKGTVIPVAGGEAIEGANHYDAHGLLLVPVAAISSLTVRGDEAQIKPGMTFTAAVAKDTRLQP